MIDDIFEKVKPYKKRAKSALDEIFEDFEKVKTIDTFIYRFIKLQYTMGDKLFRAFLDEIGEYKSNMSLLDILEKFEIRENAKDWMRYRKLRNQLTHKYPNNEDETIEGIKMTIKTYYQIDVMFNNISNYYEKRVLKR